jgi:formate-dependent nitrite reductase membrane component NrfD
MTTLSRPYPQDKADHAASPLVKAEIFFDRSKRASDTEQNKPHDFEEPTACINISYITARLHFQNFPPKLKFLAMLTSFTGRITATLPVIVVIIGVVVTVPV